MNYQVEFTFTESVLGADLLSVRSSMHIMIVLLYFLYSDPIPQSLGTAGNSTDLDCTSVQARTASIEVDILKCNSMRDSEENTNLTSSHFDKNQNSASRNLTELVDADREIICIGDERSDNGDQADKESIKNDVKILIPNQLPPQEVNMESVAILTSDAEREEEISNIEERFQTSLCLHQQNCKDENICKKSVDHTGQRNNSVSQTQRNEAYFTAASIVCDASICHDGKEKETKTEQRQPSQVGSSAENSSEVNASLSKLQVDLEHFSQFDPSLSYHKEETNVLNRASKQSDCTEPSTKEETVDCKLAKSSEDERNSLDSQPEESNSNESNESDESSDSLEFAECETSERAIEQDHFLPSVEQFEEDFKKYLESVSNVVDNSIEKLPQAGELSDDYGIYSKHILRSNFKDDGYDETTKDAHAASQQFDTHPDTCHQMLHQDSYRTGYCSEQNVQGPHQTNLYFEAFHDNILPEGGWNSLYPCDQCDWFSNHNYYHDQSYNNYYSPFYGHHVADWWANAPRHPDSASSQQCPGQFYGDIGSYQDYQWNMSWYNAYQRQTSCIRQFVSFSRSARM